MICEKCNSDMKLRSGVHGDFWFCPKQKSCGQKTISHHEVAEYNRKKCRNTEISIFGEPLGIIRNDIPKDPREPYAAADDPLFDPEYDDYIEECGCW